MSSPSVTLRDRRGITVLGLVLLVLAILVLLVLLLRYVPVG